MYYDIHMLLLRSQGEVMRAIRAGLRAPLYLISASDQVQL